MPPARQRLRPVLLCADAAIVAEVASLGDAAATDNAGNDDDNEQAESIVLAIGHALSPAAPAAVLALAARVAVQRKWHATLARLLPALAAANAPLSAGADSLLHEAVRCGDANIVAAVCAAGAACGRAVSRGARDVTPMHLAVAVRDAASRQAMLAAMCDADADAPLVWFSGRDADGRTPVQAAAACGGGGAVAASLRARLVSARAAAMAAMRQARDEHGVFEPAHAVEVAASALVWRSDRTARDAIAILRAAQDQIPDMPLPEEEVAESSFFARALALLPTFHMPGSFADITLEQHWVAKAAEQQSHHDACIYAFCGLIHVVEMCRLTLPESDSQLGAQLLYVRAPPHYCFTCLLNS